MTPADQPGKDRPSELVLQLMPSARTVGQVRRAVGDFCRAGEHAALADDAELLTSELMTNACAHSQGLITVVALRNGASVVVTVTDDDTDGRAQVPPSQDLQRESGRGLFLVDAIAGAWGTSAHADSKSVWFRLP